MASSYPALKFEIKIFVGRLLTFAAKPLSSALENFTSVFGMGTGGASPELSPYKNLNYIFSNLVRGFTPFSRFAFSDLEYETSLACPVARALKSLSARWYEVWPPSKRP